jgi:hypothetical protein
MTKQKVKNEVSVQKFTKKQLRIFIDRQETIYNFVASELAMLKRGLIILRKELALKEEKTTKTQKGVKANGRKK